MSYSNGPRIVTDGLACCLDASNFKSYSGGTVWKDLSGNNRDFIFSATPSSTNNYIQFTNGVTTASGPESNSFGINNTSGYTIFVIHYQPFIVGSGATLLRFWRDGVGGAARGISIHPGWGGNTIFLDQGGCCVGGSQRISWTTTSPELMDRWTITTLISRGSSYRGIFFANSSSNGERASTTSASALLDLNSSNVTLGYIASDGYSYVGYINYIAIYSRGLSNNEYLQNYNALKGRFNL
jgi:hypothetical protein